MGSDGMHPQVLNALNDSGAILGDIWKVVFLGGGS